MILKLREEERQFKKQSFFNSQVNKFYRHNFELIQKVKLIRAYGECLGIGSR